MGLIIIRMSGGLGNQMFQYAFYRKLVSLGRDVSFDDTTEYAAERSAEDAEGNARPVTLPVFGIRYPVCCREDLIRLTDSDLHLAARVRRKLFGRHSLEHHDQDFIYDARFLTLEEGYFTGCFQSPLYFQGIEEEIRQAFTFPEDLLVPGKETHCAGIRPLSEEAAVRSQKMRDRILSAGSACAVHLRFGDYLTKSRVYGGITTEAYYRAAMDLIQRKRSDVTFFVFSNDEERAKTWAAAQQHPERCVIVSGNDETHGYVDLYLMTLCRDFVTANSSFSFWGAWLGKATDKTVVTPTYWVNDEKGQELKRTDIFPPAWLRVSPRGEVLPEESDPETASGIEDGTRRSVTEQKRNGAAAAAAAGMETKPAAGAAVKEEEDKPLVSVIVAACNVERYIMRALQSLQEQTCRDMEFIVVDDGSSDQTGQICERFAAEDPRFRVIHQENGGLSAARNTGLAAARGQWIGYLDGDDAAVPWMYESMLRAGVMAGADVALCAYREVPDSVTERETGSEERGNTSGAAERAEKKRFSNEKISARDHVDQCVRQGIMLSRQEALDIYVRSGVADEEGDIHFYNSVWSKLFRHSVAGDLVFPVGRNSEDILYTTRALLRAEKVVYLPEGLYLYTCGRTGSIMNAGVGQRRLHDEIPFYEEQLELFRNAGLKETAEKAEFYLARRLLFYWDDFDQAKDASARAYADQICSLLERKKDELIDLVNRASYGREGDRKRLLLFLKSPAAYRQLRNLYAKFRSGS